MRIGPAMMLWSTNWGGTMKKVITSEKTAIKLWLDDMDSGALAQVKNLANLPFIFKHVAVMPDAHQGYGMPIGGVMASEEMVIPMRSGLTFRGEAVRTSLTVIHRLKRSC
jgi:tRNA-splicing ligase RtcB